MDCVALQRAEENLVPYKITLCLYFCQCFYSTNSRDQAYARISALRKTDTHYKGAKVVSMVDQESYQELVTLMQWTVLLPPFKLAPPTRR